MAAAAAASFVMLALQSNAFGEGAAAPTMPAPAGGHMRLALVGIRSDAPFALTREPIEVRGVVEPYVAGQSVRVTLYSNGRSVGGSTLSVAPHGAGRGVFQGSFRSAPPGHVRVLAVHAATPQMQQLVAQSEDITVLSPPQLAVGARGATVWLLQRALGALHYAVPQSGYFDEATADAVIAYRKMTGLVPVGNADESVFGMLKRGAGAFHVRYPQDGRHVEADLSKQVLAEIEPHGRVYNIYPTSSGKPSTPTVLGHFYVYLKTPGLNSESMLDSNYFIRGYAIHGYPEVPTYPASHGCLRVPNLDAPSIYGWVRIGTPVDVYY
jgi:peptidoglycan hydrolase-like protein with peptidoglycan-binding domain